MVSGSGGLGFGRLGGGRSLGFEKCSPACVWYLSSQPRATKCHCRVSQLLAE